MFSKNKKAEKNVQVKASLAYTICSIVQKGLTFITMPIFTRLLTEEQYGLFSIYFSWSAIITIFTTLNLPYGSFSKAMVKFEDSRNQYISAVQVICIILSVVLFAIYFPLRKYFNEIFELPTFLVIIMLVEIVANFAILCWSGRCRFEYKYISVVLVTILIALCSPAVALIFIFTTGEANKGYARILGSAFVTIAVGTAFLIYNFAKGKNPFKKDMFKYALGMNGALIFYYLSQVVFNQSDRIMISHMIGMDKAAIYSVAYNLAIVLTFIIDAINNSYVPWFYEKIKKGEAKDNKKISVLLTIFIGFLLLGIIALAPELIYILAGKNYLEAKWVVAPIAMSLLLLFLSQQFINVEFYYEKKYFLVIASIGAALVNVGLNFWLIPKYGYIAAGYTTLLSYIIFALCNYLVFVWLLKRQKLKNDMYNIPLLLLILVVFMGIGFLAMFLYNYSIVRYIIIGVVLLTLAICSKWIYKFAKKFFNKKEENEEKEEVDEVKETENQ